MDSPDGDLHIVVFPWFAFGHMLPFLELSKSLAKRGHRVSFISTPRNLSRLPTIPAELSPLVDLVSFPLPPVDNLPADAESTNDLRPEQIQFLKKALDGLQIGFSQFLRASSRKPDWIILDFCHHWAPPIASEFNIPCACFCIVNALTIVFLWGDVEAAAQDNGEWRKTIEEFAVPPKWIPFPSNLAFRPHEAQSLTTTTLDNASGISDIKRLSSLLKGCSFIAIRSCFEFDSVWLSLAAELYKKPVIPAGLLPPSGVRGGRGCGGGQTAHPNAGEAGILEWLSKQLPGSVVYVAFGSEAMLTAEQDHELALGLELSKTPFLWARRRPANAVAEPLPEAFEERTKNYGLVAAGWIPQLEILSHPSVGAFFTHCGWNSVIEGLQFGHPFIMLPLIIDQGLIVRRLEEEKVGVTVPCNEEGSFTREAVATAIRKVTVEEEGKVMRSNARKLQEVFADKDLHESYIDNFIQHLKIHKE